MARGVVSIGEILRLRKNPLFLSHPTLVHSKPTLPPSSPFNSSASSDLNPTNLFKICFNRKQLFQIQAHLITCGLFRKPYFQGRVLKCAADLGDLNYTILVFQCIQFPDTFCINSVIKAYACSNVPQEAVAFYFDMLRNGFVPNSFTFAPLISSCAKAGCLASGRKCHGQATKNGVDWYLNGGNPGCCLMLFRKMMRLGLRGSDTTVMSVFTACGRSARLKEGRSVHSYLIKRFVHSSLIIDTALIDMYSKCRRVDVAKLVFDRMLGRNLVCWNAMILGHCIHGNPEDGLTLYAKMLGTTCSRDEETVLDNNVKPDEITFAGILCACARSGLLIEGRTYFTQMFDLFSIEANFAHYWCMANLFAGVGLVQEALNIIRSMPVNEEESSQSLLWARLLGACRFEGSVILGEQIAKAVIELEPENSLCYALLLNVYAVAGQWEDVAKMKQMIKEQGIRKMAGCSLFDLKEVVHNLKFGDSCRQHMQEVAISTQGTKERNARLSQLIHSNISCAKALKQRYYVVKVVRLQENCSRDGEVHSDKLNKEEQISRHGKLRESGFNFRLVFGVVNIAQTPHEHGDRKQLPSGKHHVTTNIQNHQMTTENSATKEQIDEHNKPENHDRETMVELQAVQSLNHHP
ncbi:hypothetical protein C3L33_17807, partial [Rhododendron williamsianum]